MMQIPIYAGSHERHAPLMIIPVYVNVIPCYGYSPIMPIMPQTGYVSPQLQNFNAMPKSGYLSESNKPSTVINTDDEMSDILDANDPILVNDLTTDVEEEFFTSRFAASSALQDDTTDDIPRLEMCQSQPLSIESMYPVNGMECDIQNGGAVDIDSQFSQRNLKDYRRILNVLLRHDCKFRLMHNTDIVEWTEFKHTLEKQCAPHLERLKKDFIYDFEDGKDNFELHGYKHKESGWSYDYP